MDTYENKQAWNRCVKNAFQAGVNDNPTSVVHVEARTLAERSAMLEQKRDMTRSSFLIPDLPWLSSGKGATTK